MDLRSIKEFIKDAFKYILIIIVVFLIFLYVVSFQKIMGPSMTPNYIDKDIHILNKISYKFSDPKRFNVIVFDSKEEKQMVKRVIGLPGETVEYKDNKLYINDKQIEETFKIKDKTTNYKLKEKIPENHYFVLGDNRTNSKDSRHYGLINKKDIIGKVEFRIWPIIK